MALLAELGQCLITLVFSVAVVHVVGTAYILVGALVALTCVVLLMNAAHDRLLALPLLEAPPSLLKTIGSVTLTATVFGAVWPAIPLIFAWGAWRERETEASVG